MYGDWWNKDLYHGKLEQWSALRRRRYQWWLNNSNQQLVHIFRNTEAYFGNCLLYLFLYIPSLTCEMSSKLLLSTLFAALICRHKLNVAWNLSD